MHHVEFDLSKVIILRTRFSVAPSPRGCRWCGIMWREHGWGWVPSHGLHNWTEPTSEQRRARMLARRARTVALRETGSVT